MAMRMKRAIREEGSHHNLPDLESSRTLRSDVVSIPKDEYEKLLEASAELERLRAALKTEQPSQSREQDTARASVEQAESVDDESDGGVPLELETLLKLEQESPAHRAHNASAAGGEISEPSNKNTSIVIRFPRGLKDAVGHAAVAAVIRGGPLLQIYMHRRINHANVTFARAEDAAAFLEYAQAEPFFIGGHHTSLDWATQPYVTPEYVRAQVNSGDVSRNLVILAVRPNVTETVLRRDLAHIHNLTVISVKFEDGNAYISTNSVGGALYARTCLKSRKLYKDMWVGFYKDECAGPLPPRVPHAAARVPPAKRGAVYNPYELLSGSEFVLGSSEDDEE